MNTQGLYIARLLDSGLRTLATGAVLRQHTDLNGGQAFDDRVSDRMTRLVYLGEALAVDEPEVLLSHVRWLRDSYAARGVAVDEAAEGLTALRDELREELPAQAHDRVSDLLDQARTTLEGPPTALGQVQLADRAQALVGALVDADRERAIELALDELDEGGFDLGPRARAVGPGPARDRCALAAGRARRVPGAPGLAHHRGDPGAGPGPHAAIGAQRLDGGGGAGPGQPARHRHPHRRPPLRARGLDHPAGQHQPAGRGAGADPCATTGRTWWPSR